VERYIRLIFFLKGIFLWSDFLKKNNIFGLIDLRMIPSSLIHPTHHGTSTMVKQASRNATKTKGAVTKKKTVTKAKQKKEQDHHHASSSSSSPSIRSKFVGVHWNKPMKKWKAKTEKKKRKKKQKLENRTKRTISHLVAIAITTSAH